MKMKYIIDNENKAMRSISADIYDKVARKRSWQSQQGKDKALTHYIDSISKTDIQDY